MVVLHAEAAGLGDGLELVVREPPAEVPARGRERVEEDVVGIVHPIDAEDGLQAAFVEARIVRDQREPLDQGLYLCPYIREDRRILGVFGAESMDPPAEPLVVLRFGVDEAVEGVHDFASADDDDAHAADAGGLFVGGFKVDGGEIEHTLQRYEKDL